MITQKKRFLKILAMCVAVAAFVAVLSLNGTAKAQSEREKVAFPELEQSVVYDGTVKSPQLDERYYSSNQNSTFTVAGTYNVKVRLTDTSRYCWEDGTDDEITVKFTIEKAVFDESALGFYDQTFVYDEKEHYLDVEGLPSFAKVVFKTLERNPGVYDSVVQIDLGPNYVNNEIELKGAKMTILATYVEGDDFVFINSQGFSHEVTLKNDYAAAKAFERKLPAAGSVYAVKAPEAEKNGSEYDFGTGSYKYRILVPTRYIGVKAFVNDGGKAKEVKIDWDGQYATIETQSLCEFAVIYSGTVVETPQFLWLEILMGVMIIAEACFIAYMVVKLKKTSKAKK